MVDVTKQVIEFFFVKIVNLQSTIHRYFFSMVSTIISITKW